MFCAPDWDGGGIPCPWAPGLSVPVDRNSVVEVPKESAGVAGGLDGLFCVHHRVFIEENCPRE